MAGVTEEAEAGEAGEADLRATGVVNIPPVTRIPVAAAVAEAILVVPVEIAAIPAEGRIISTAGGTIQVADAATRAETRATTTGDVAIPAVEGVIIAAEIGTTTVETADTITAADAATDEATMTAASIQIAATIMVDDFGPGLTLELESVFPSDTAIIPIRGAATTTAWATGNQHRAIPIFTRVIDPMR